MVDRPRRFRAGVLVFFFTSGVASLVLEVTWSRMLGTVFGNTVYAVSTVLTAFMLGLALGSAVLGRVADRIPRPLAIYGLLELGIGIYAFLFPLALWACGGIYEWFFRTFAPAFGWLTAFRFVLSVLILLPPTFLMGGTLPLLGRHLGLHDREPGREVGYLYGANTIGAVTGCFLAGFVLLEALGVRGTLFTAAAVALSVGSAALMLGQRAGSAVASPKTTAGPARERASGVVEPASESMYRFVLIAFGITGFCSLACEVVWTRILIFLVSTSVYSFATMLTTFLGGIGIGSFLSSRFLVPRVRRPLVWFGGIEVLLGLSVLLSIAVLGHLEFIDAQLRPHFEWGGWYHLVLVHFADAFVVIFLPTLLMGLAFPLVTTACLRGDPAVGRRTGQIYAANTIGCVLGSFAAGFLLLPFFGTRGSLLVLVSLNLAIGALVVWRSSGLSLRACLVFAAPLAAAVAAAFVVIPTDVFHRTINAYHHPSKIVFIREHSAGTVTVHDLPTKDRLIAVDGINVAGLDFMLRSTQKLQGYIPLCLHPEPRRVLQIGFGSGETTRVGLEFGVPEYTIVEICSGVFEAGKYFEEINKGSYRDPRLRKIIMDGKNFARLSGETFDIVMNDSIYPGSSGSSALYTVDHFENCRNRLAPGGVFSCWVPIDLRPSEVRMMLKSFQTVFPHTSVWVASNCLNKHSLFLGTLEPLRIDFARVQSVVQRPAIAADLASVEIHDVYDFLDCFVLDPAAVAKLVERDPLNTDDRPRLEFSYAIKPAFEVCLLRVFSMLERHRTPVEPYLENFVDEERDRAELARRFEATNHIFRGQSAQLAGFPKIRRQEFDLALKANPGEVHVASCNAELEREIRELRSALKDRPRNLVIARRLADKVYAAMLFEEAENLYARLIRMSPPPPPVDFVRLASMRFSSGRVAAAEEVLQACLSAWPESAEAHDRLAGIYFRTRRIDDARRHAAEALRIEPENRLYKEHHAAIFAAKS